MISQQPGGFWHWKAFLRTQYDIGNWKLCWTVDCQDVQLTMDECLSTKNNIKHKPETTREEEDKEEVEGLAPEQREEHQLAVLMEDYTKDSGR